MHVSSDRGEEGGGWFENVVVSDGGGVEHIVGYVAHSLMHNEPLKGSSIFSSDVTMQAHEASTINPTFVIHGNQ